MADKKKELFHEATQLLKAGKYGQASKVVKELLSLEPSNIEFRRLSASLNLNLGNLISAKAIYESLVQEALQVRDRRFAETLLREYLAAGPRYVPFLELLGRVCEENGNAMVAANEYGKALQILLEDGDPSEGNHAADLYAKIRDLAPNNPVLLQYDPTKFRQVQPASAQPAAPPPPPLKLEPVQAAAAAPPPPPSVEDLPMVDDDLSEILAKPPAPPPRPAPVAPQPQEKPSLAKTLFSFFQPSPQPEPGSAAPEAPAAETAEPAPVPAAAGSVPVEEAPPAPPPWKPSEQEPQQAAAPAAPAPAPPVSAPASEPQGVAWKPWQPTEPALQPAKPADAVPVTPASAARPEKPAAPFTAPSFGVSGEMPQQPMSIPAATRGALGTAARPRPAAAYRPSKRRGLQSLTQMVRKIAILAGAIVALGLLGVVLLAVTFLVLEQSPSEVYQKFVSVTPPSGGDPRKSGYVLLLGFGVDAGRDPMAEGYERLKKATGVHQPHCVWESETAPLSADAAALGAWWYGSDPMGQFQKEASRIQTWASQRAALLARYHQWLSLPVEDAGYGSLAVPDCALVLATHRLYVAEGFASGLAKGIDQLEEDLSTWRAGLAKARTLPFKQLAFAAVNDDLTVLAGVLSRPELDGNTVSRLTELAKPLEQVEGSLRWAMQNALTVDAKLLKTSAIFDAVKDSSLPLQVVSHLPLPTQRMLNAYADYFEVLLKAVDQPLTSPPRLYEFARTPARTVVDDVVNPVDNLVPGRSAVAWDREVGTVIETEARLRLVRLAAMLRGVPRKSVPTRIAQTGQKYYDPFTEFPMLMNQSKGLLYSQGKNRRDDEGDPKLDVTIPFPLRESPKESSKEKTR